nr:hypothetical protein [Lachnospiraceae bacterium]
DLIVVNLGTNDASYTRDHEDRKEVFKQAYQRFLRYLTGTHRGKPIVCVTNAMTDLLGYEIDEAIKAVRAEENAPLYLMRFSDNEEGDGEGAVGHPSLIRHEKMAVQLSDWIRKKVIF